MPLAARAILRGDYTGSLIHGGFGFLHGGEWQVSTCALSSA
ncbi:hypothetical protein HQ82_0084 [Dickeya phage phiDP10.3]|uniref:Uncharacterized protein n=1 Tax=Dickeya phage phiDP10.3 TaxID=1542132 RepID=A0A140XAZ3_9CAUD|nr:hypothetical protein HQ82_0084 [Dickeya phage phiDP10.3]